MELAGARVLVVGASSGIGREVAVQLGAAGARVVVAARRADRLTEVVAEIGDRAASAVCDVREPAQCDAVVATAVEALGGLDAVVYATAVDPLVRLVDTDLERWRQVYDTNVFGASLVTRAALAPLAASGGRMVYISATSVGRPLPGMGAYETSKAALDELVRAWRSEHPEIGFCNVAVGNTLGTEVHETWDRDLLMELAPVWETRGYVYDNGPGAMSVPDCATAVIAAIASPVDLRYVVANPAPGSTMDVG
ncbi:MAG TPA: SDR family NAD(P)-dependent oxidoreductase [Acidimicrobiia bacterium]|jgi:NAD(P)-dependent dehydrogenase (short-subunit alcohol dehydrogenase family)